MMRSMVVRWAMPPHHDGFQTHAVSGPEPANQRERIRLVVQQPTLTKHRVPVFTELSKRPNIQLKVVYSELPTIPNVHSEAFDSTLEPTRSLNLLNQPLF